MKKSTIIGIVVVVVIIIAGVYLATQNNKNENTPAGDNPVTISNFAFSPNIITVHVGDTVTWKNNDGATHTVTSDSNSTEVFNSGNMNQERRSRSLSLPLGTTGTIAPSTPA